MICAMWFRVCPCVPTSVIIRFLTILRRFCEFRYDEAMLRLNSPKYNSRLIRNRVLEICFVSGKSRIQFSANRPIIPSELRVIFLSHFLWVSAWYLKLGHSRSWNTVSSTLSTNHAIILRHILWKTASDVKWTQKIGGAAVTRTLTLRSPGSCAPPCLRPEPLPVWCARSVCTSVVLWYIFPCAGWRTRTLNTPRGGSDTVSQSSRALRAQSCVKWTELEIYLSLVVSTVCLC
jgi:hypothetical protein